MLWRCGQHYISKMAISFTKPRNSEWCPGISWEDQNLTASDMTNVEPQSTIGAIVSAMLSSYWNRTSNLGLFLIFWRKMPEKGMTYLVSMYIQRECGALRFETHNKFNITDASSSDGDLLFFDMRGELSELRKPHFFFWVDENKLVRGLSHNTYDLMTTSCWGINQSVFLQQTNTYSRSRDWLRLHLRTPPNFFIYHQFWQRNP